LHIASQPALRVQKRTKELQYLARALLRLRHERQCRFQLDVTGPVWDLLLVLFDADNNHHRPSVGDLAVRARVARTTTIRWLRQMERHGLITLLADHRDRRLVRVSLTKSGGRIMESLLGAAGLKAD
jgi:DNA-binding MarR family transcriptional regulator